MFKLNLGESGLEPGQRERGLRVAKWKVLLKVDRFALYMNCIFKLIVLLSSLVPGVISHEL